ncbi:MAG: glycosyltransferase family 2 protein [candidate division WOR-3 bacterium]|jgi:cellulose synthase/poly-beta-1,6-N-acetylglucosamine synthase-like glycosyltransferase|nr:glycosyltransferase family 2 protein [candidate division WOR-3 bacterium]MCR4424378.1 glycosyltransferase family 2 protein [candidate division WOR-3 bacterium]MDH7518196.1 glycosyltransferase family 2 protein [bacterium]
MFEPLAVVLFWVPLGVIFYHWVIFPALLWIWAKLFPRKYHFEKRDEPLRVSVVMAVYNEEAIIAEKMKNILAMEYPADYLEILIGSDNSTDRTDEIIRSFNDPRVRLIHYDEQSGKTVVQNRLLEIATGDVVLCTDADSLLTPEALKLMVEKFLDPRVGVVNPKYRRVNEDGSPAESFYDLWESKVKELEGKIGAMVGCNAYANMVRRSLATPIPDDTILDDFILGIRPFRFGYDVVCEPRALVVTRAESETVEYRRKSRISSGNLQALLRCYDLLSPKYGRKAWVYFSHKVIRMMVPFLLLAMLIGAGLHFRYPFFAVLFGLQLLAYATIPLLFVVPRRWRKLLIIQYYLYLNIGLVIGYWRYLFRRERFWKKTPRTAPPPELS